MDGNLRGLDSITLTRYVLHGQRAHNHAKGDLTILLTAVQLACKVTDLCVRRSGIAKLYGLAGIGNFQSESDKDLETLANDTFKTNIEACEKVSIMVSEGDQTALVLERNLNAARYAIAFDPLDGASNIDANISVGSIFAIYRIADPESINSPEEAKQAILQKGADIAAAGYAMYGSATNLVISTGDGVHGFTLDPSLGEFVLTHPSLTIKPRGNIYSVNEGNSDEWDEPTKRYVDSIKFPTDVNRKPYSLRYIGTMVADVHRTLFYGGVFMYPRDCENPDGKLRLMYEASPMAFLIENAGGIATTGWQRVLDIVPSHVHETCPIYMGSREDIKDLLGFFSRYGEPPHASHRESEDVNEVDGNGEVTDVEERIREVDLDAGADKPIER